MYTMAAKIGKGKILKMKDNNMTFSEKLKSARAETGLSQVKASAALGVPRRTYENWEAGSRVPAEYVQESVLKKLEEIRGDDKK